jgi:hypothetical protein
MISWIISGAADGVVKMRYFLRTGPTGDICGVWEIRPDEAVRIDVRGGPGTRFKAEPGQEIFDAIRRQADSWFGPDGENLFREVDLPPGVYHPRIARPNDQIPEESVGVYPGPVSESEAIGRVQLAVLAGQLDRIFQTVHPTERNMEAYGHDIRNLLILAATEVEAQSKGVLAANDYSKSRPTMVDYVKLLKPMRLDEYEIGLPQYPWLPPVSPFAGWEPMNPSKSLPWHTAYNATKHDREGAFHAGTLKCAVAAVCACAVLIVAQYGSLSHRKGPRTELDRFIVAKGPNWSLAQLYIGPYGRPDGWASRACPL